MALRETQAGGNPKRKIQAADVTGLIKSGRDQDLVLVVVLVLVLDSPHCFEDEDEHDDEEEEKTPSCSLTRI